MRWVCILSMIVLDTLFSRIQQRLVQGDLITAAQEIAEWMDLQPEDAGALTACVHLLRLRGCYADAAAMLDRSLVVAPNFVPSLVEAARIARHAGQLDRALKWYEQAHRIAPDAVDWRGEWIELLQQLQRFELAAQIAEKWCEVCPDLPQAWFLLGLVHQQNDSHSAALDAYHHAMALDSGYPMLRNNLAALHHSMQDYQMALRFCAEAIHAEPDSFRAWTNAANTWLRLREPGHALIAAERACTLAPEYTLALLAYSNTLKELQRWDEAFDVIARAALATPDDAQIQWSLAMLQLVRGDYQNGFVNHEARWSGSSELKKTAHLLPEPRWQGEDLVGKTLFVWGEQGFGDAFQFVRFVPQIADRVRRAGGTLIYSCFAGVFPLFERSLAECGLHMVPHDVPQLPVFDYHIPVGSLPLALGITLDNLPAPRSYLLPDAAKAAYWRRKLRRSSRVKVGLVWSGSRTHQRNPLRSIPPALYAHALAQLPDIEFFSLQLDGADEVKQMASAGFHVTDHVAGLRSFDESAALICNMDLVITVCTSVAHLSGALGVPTWLMLDVNPHWVWMLERSDSPWYPSMKIYRQHQYANWSTALEQIRADLLTLVSQKS